MPTFADMKEIKFEYRDQSVMFVTVFDDIAQMDTSAVEGYMILACDGGRMQVDVSGMTQQLSEGEALILPPRTRLSGWMVSPDVRCDLAVIATDAVKQMLQNHIQEWNRCIYVNKTNHIVTDEAARQQFGHYAGILSFKMGQTDLRYNREVVQSIMRSILFDYLELMMAAVPQSNDAGEPAVGQRQVLFNRFLELLSTRHVKHQLVDTYAQELCVSPNYLTKVCRELTGKTALQWVREYTEADVRYYLLNSDMSVKEICDHLGFPNLSFFGKYCRRAFGLSPTEFRKQKENK
jgi:AraC family transcriptional activator of pobA